MSRSSVSERLVRTVGTFALLGPLVGVGVVWIGLIGLAIFTGDDAWDSNEQLLGYLLGIPPAVALSVAFGYLFGVLPAATTGIVCHLFSRSIRSDALWILASAVVGAGIGAMAVAIMSDGEPDYLSLGMFVIPGAGAAAACALKLRRRRWE